MTKRRERERANVKVIVISKSINFMISSQVHKLEILAPRKGALILFCSKADNFRYLRVSAVVVRGNRLTQGHITDIGALPRALTWCRTGTTRVQSPGTVPSLLVGTSTVDLPFFHWPRGHGSNHLPLRETATNTTTKLDHLIPVVIDI